ERIHAVEVEELFAFRLPPLAVPADRTVQILLAHLDHRRAFALALDRQLVRRHVERARHIAKLEFSRIDKLRVDHRETKRLPLQPLLQDRGRAGIARAGLQPLPFLAELLAGLLAGELLIGGEHAAGAGTLADES